tara:strand:+ start:133 stop:519 length:387 start_codon:yes stop_codon:yes gene_type:complete
MKTLFNFLYVKPYKWFMGLTKRNKIISISGLVIFLLLFAPSYTPEMYYKEWTEDFDRAKSTYCSCRDGAFKSTRNLEKQERKLRDCMLQFQRYYEYLEDEDFNNASYADSLFLEINKYVQRGFNQPCD